ncbi:hypothetical protein A9R01_08350 ['Osedax' symbiont bacterium Rs2_46_30_T18]|nr:hypothetical protein A9R01_08350 ['Osedax' symbiont bacterium Rs2_46_30_T18]
MNMEKKSARFFNMTQEVWERHANPLSVYSRYSCLPLLCVAIWSRVWIGWYSLLPVALVCLWVWLNPRVFGRPNSTDNWASRAVLGERVLLAQSEEGIPRHHKSAIRTLKWVITFGFLCAVYGLIFLHLWLAVFGTIITILAKTWFLDRMVWLYQDLSETHPEYKRWLY